MRSLSASEDSYIASILDRATALVDGYLHRSFEDDQVPAPVRWATAGVAGRLLSAAANAQDGFGAENVSNMQAAMGPFQVSQTFAGGGTSLWISNAEREMLSGYRVSAVVVDTALPETAFTSEEE